MSLPIADDELLKYKKVNLKSTDGASVRFYPDCNKKPGDCLVSVVKYLKNSNHVILLILQLQTNESILSNELASEHIPIYSIY